MKLQDAIKFKTAIHCTTEKEAKRILGMANKLGYDLSNGDKYTLFDFWGIHKGRTCYDTFFTIFGDIRYFIHEKYTIIPSTQIENFTDSKEIKNKVIIKQTNKQLEK